ncbi:MAG: Clp protease N-terminal domain-containing protein [Candidatus Velthaea sp.]
MDTEQLPLSDELLDVMRRAAAQAFQSGTEFVGPAHLLLALLEAPSLRDVLAAHVRRGDVLAETRRKKLPGVVGLRETGLAEGEMPPFPRYDTLAFQTTDGSRLAWLDSEAFSIFLEGARRVEIGAYKPKHLALGYVAESITDPDLQALVQDVRALTAAVFAL